MKSRLSKYFLFLLIFLMSFSLVSCSSNSNASDEGVKVYKAALEPTFPPFDMMDESGVISGFDVDLLNAIAKDQNFKVEWSQMGFDGLILALKSGNIDIVASGLSITDERKQEVDFSDSYFDAGFILGVKADNNVINGIDSISGNMKIAAQIGTMSADIISKWQKDKKILEAKIYDKVNDAIMDVLNGSVDAILNDKPVLLEYMAKHANSIKIVGDVIQNQPYGIAVKKGNKELLEKINAGLNNLKKSGEYDKLLSKWKLK